MSQQYQVIQAPKEFFETEAPPLELPTLQIMELEKLVKLNEGGLLSFYKRYKYPMRGFIDDEILLRTDYVKKVLLGYVRFFGSKPLCYFAGFIFLLPPFLFNRIVDKWIESYLWVSWNSIQYKVYSPDLLSQPVRELYRVGMIIADDNKNYEKLVKILCAVLEFDRQYRYRVQDIIVYLKTTQSPRKEFEGLFKMFLYRDSQKYRFANKEKAGSFEEGKKDKKWTELGLVTRFLFLRKSVRQLAQQFVDNINIDEMALSIEDQYWCLLNPHYDFMGICLEKRTEMWKEL